MEKQSVFCHTCGEKDEILYCSEDPGQKGRDDGESNNLRPIQTPERSSTDDHVRPWQRVCMLERNRESVAMRYVFCGSVLRMAKRNKREPERIIERVLSERTLPFESKSENARKKSGVN